MLPGQVVPPESRVYVIKCRDCGYKYRQRLGRFGTTGFGMKCLKCKSTDLAVDLSLLEKIIKY